MTALPIVASGSISIPDGFNIDSVLVGETSASSGSFVTVVQGCVPVDPAMSSVLASGPALNIERGPADTSRSPLGARHSYLCHSLL